MDIHCSNINRHWQNKLCYFRNCTEKPNICTVYPDAVRILLDKAKEKEEGHVWKG
ncbi:uncharacterized protein PHALS_13239 [Plasmopara halstedii]|uniref:Uncharacterized protein n=1 Tax=Plasmopara halstedii TaxID=4781 RepID=A0A0P1AQ59_PLAHL|nr:uncharacterized protein PHALS_13239 [Plasmopara halstedii]CEG43014.1 hypothetical protein PHALS_13239 [Plasmopara halstedii]|eukprot:XP_024579383.1 hypothetical protein PHALS_13239 [Plasmopara halstedii]